MCKDKRKVMFKTLNSCGKILMVCPNKTTEKTYKVTVILRFFTCAV